MKTIQVVIKDQYGAQTIRPVCHTAQLFAKLAGTKTLTRQALETIRALGYQIEVKQPSLTI
jgi:hypothetical protein